MSWSPMRRPILAATLTIAAVTSSSATYAQEVWDGSIVDYANYCTDVAGGAIPDFDCERDGTLIPITVNGRAPSSANPATCDRPALIEPVNHHACQQGSRLCRLHFDDPALSGVFICRATCAFEGERPVYEEVAIIQHHAISGATCWFRAATRASDGDTRIITGAVRSPLKSATVNTSRGDGDIDVEWQTASRFVCQTCHAADPYILSPFVEQVQQGGQRVMPSVYDVVPPERLRVWSPGQTGLDQLVGERIVYDRESAGQECVRCHAMVSVATANRIQTFTDAALGITKGLTNHGQNHAIDPRLAWMHVGKRPFAFSRPSTSTTAAGQDLMACMKGARSGICHHEPIPGRPFRGIVLDVGGVVAGERVVAPDVPFGVSGRLLYYDFTDRIRYQLRRMGGSVIETRVGGQHQSVQVTPRCRDGEALELVATAVDAGGQPITDLGVTIERRQVLRCREPTRSRWSSTTMTLDAVPLPPRSGAMMGNSGGPRSVPVSDLLIGDDASADTWRSYLQFPIEAGEPVGLPIAAQLTFTLQTEAGNPVGNLSDVSVVAYDYGDTFTFDDWNDPAAFRRGYTSFAAAVGVVDVDVTEQVRSAVQEGRPVASFGVWFRMPTDSDGADDVMRIQNTPRDDGLGGIDFNTTLQPVLTVLYAAP